MGIEWEGVAETAFDSIKDFASLSKLEQNSADFAVLKGSIVGGEYFTIYSYVALSCLDTLEMNRKKFNVVFDRELDKLEHIYDKVLSLGIPELIEREYDGDGDTDPDVYNESKSYLTSLNMPYAVVGFGEKDNEEEVVILFFAKGGSPKDALLEFKNVVHSRKQSFN
jgi:hypothetical protein